jgi:DNA-binding beta-propeller fold protein YncE
MSVFFLKSESLNVWENPAKNPAALSEDPYESGWTALSSDLSFGTCGSGSGQLQGPHGIDIAPDGRIYVADSGNHRIVVLSPVGEVLTSWGSFGDVNIGTGQAGTFNEPWDLAFDGVRGWIYVADTWNHRIQKFDLDGNPITMWGYGAYDPESTDPFGLWGPRGIAVDERGRVFVADTGNKRILVFTENGSFLSQIGQGGMDPGEFEEPVGLAVDGNGLLYVADTWNQRIQVFSPDPLDTGFSAYAQWPIEAWELDSIDNKPYLAIDDAGNVFITDPEGARVLAFSPIGAYSRSWGDFGSGNGQFGLASGIAVDPQGRIWVSDPPACRIERFPQP